MPFQCVVLGTSTQKKIVLSRSSGINGVIFCFEKDSSFKRLTVFDSGYASWLEEGRQDLIMFSYFLDVTRILIPSFIVFQNNITIDFKVEPSMKLLLSYAVTIATLSQVPLMSKGKNPFSLNAVVWAFNFQAYSRGGKKISPRRVFEKDSPSDTACSRQGGSIWTCPKEGVVAQLHTSPGWGAACPPGVTVAWPPLVGTGHPSNCHLCSSRALPVMMFALAWLSGSNLSSCTETLPLHFLLGERNLVAYCVQPWKFIFIVLMKLSLTCPLKGQGKVLQTTLSA